jgi:asparagine synthase (glutamine-hydrolysing)
MCGIFGQIGSSPADEKCGLELHHRGPDDGGLKYFALSEGSVWVSLQHRRLSIIDLSSAGHQPMCNEDESIWITFNGEIYNWLPRDTTSARTQILKPLSTAMKSGALTL